MCILSSISDDEFRSIIKSSFYLKDVIVKCGYKASLSKRTRDKIKKRIYSLDLDTSHFKYPERKTIKQLCVVNGKYHRGGLKRRLINSINYYTGIYNTFRYFKEKNYSKLIYPFRVNLKANTIFQ